MPGPAKPIDALLEPRSVAVVGASPTSFVGRIVLENLDAIGYRGPVYPVNPRYEEVAGRRCYPSVDDLPEAPDAVAAAVRIDLVPEVLRAAAKRGARAAMVPGGGFSETGQAAVDAQREIAAVAREYGMAVAGPNCMGVIAPGRAALYIGTLAPHLLPGRVAVVSQSGSVIEAMVNMGPRIGFSALVSSGTEMGTSAGEYLSYFASDPDTDAVAVFLEGFRDPAAFVDGLRAMRAAGKPAAVLQAGRSAEAAAAIAAHSGTLASADEVVTGLLHQLGAIGVDDLDELIEVSEVLAHKRLPPGPRLIAVTDSGGEAQLVADHARRLGFELPQPSPAMVERLRGRWPNFAYIGNPVDPWGVDPDFHALYDEIVDAMAHEDADIVAVALDKVTTWMGENEVDLGAAGARSLIEAVRRTGRYGVYFTLHGMGPAHESVREPLRAAGIPLLHGLRPALVALRRARWWGTWRDRTPLPAAAEPGLVSIDEPGPVLSEHASRRVLAAYGVPVVPGDVAATAEEAVRLAGDLGHPVVMKANAPGVAHKSAAGFVAVGVAGDDAVRATFDRLAERARNSGVPANGVLVEATAAGVEVICGMRHDSAFGAVVLVGVGGALTEALKQVSVRVCPVSVEDLEEMLQESVIGAMLDRAGADPEPLKQAVAALSRLAADHPEIREVDVNPMFVGEAGTCAADALVVVDAANAVLANGSQSEGKEHA
ncbi:MAG TPA: acetate--CoA ligase family protein [Actinomycetota bacterium]